MLQGDAMAQRGWVGGKYGCRRSLLGRRVQKNHKAAAPGRQPGDKVQGKPAFQSSVRAAAWKARGRGSFGLVESMCRHVQRTNPIQTEFFSHTSAIMKSLTAILCLSKRDLRDDIIT